MLHGKVLRSPHAHARIKSIDTSKAEALPGVTAVVTSKDFPIIGNVIIDLAEGGSRLLAEHIMAADKARYKGHAVAAGSATSAHIAEAALELIEVDYEVLKPVLSIQDSMKDDAPLLHDTMTTHFKMERFARGDDTGAQSNIASHIQHKLGDIDKGFADADVIVEGEYTTQTRPSRLHRAPCFYSQLGRRWTSDHLDMHPRRIRHPVIMFCDFGYPRITHQSDPNRDWRRIWSKSDYLPRASGRHLIEEERTAGESHNEPKRRL